jgi:hypothetical protein
MYLHAFTKCTLYPNKEKKTQTKNERTNPTKGDGYFTQQTRISLIYNQLKKQNITKRGQIQHRKKRQNRSEGGKGINTHD